jgi:outer membrane protein OmpA-like peptidoglycan-associated protein
MTNLSNGALVAVALAFAGLALAEPNVDERLAAAEASQAAASALNAQLLAPQNYQNGTEELDQARRDIQTGQNPERVGDRLTQTENYFEKAIAAANTARNVFAEALTQRQAAEMAKAPELASALWAKGEKELGNAASTLEKNREAAALDGAARAAAVYSEAELAAIKASVVGEARRSVSNAARLRADRYAPLTMDQARDLLLEAEQKLDADRYAISRPRELAKQSREATQLAVYLTDSVRQVQNKRLSLEEMLLDWQERLQRIASAAELQTDVAMTPDAATDKVVNRIEELRASETLLDEDLSNAQQYIASLEEEIRALDERLGGTTAARDAAVIRLEAQARAREQYNQVRNLFDANQALVVRESDTIILRLVGLNFASGSAELDASNELLLNQLARAIAVFPRCDVVVEGHTDSTGSDAMNLRLSQARADSVMKFLTVDKNIPGFRIRAVGYGDSRPIANNENVEGRDRNRRIDMLIIPKDTEGSF